MEIPEVVIPYLPLGKFHIPRHVVLACLSFSGSRKIDMPWKKEQPTLVVTGIWNSLIMWHSWFRWTFQAKCRNLKWLSVCAVFQVWLCLTRSLWFDKVLWHLDFVLLSMYSGECWMPLKLLTANPASNGRSKKAWLVHQSYPQLWWPKSCHLLITFLPSPPSLYPFGCAGGSTSSSTLGAFMVFFFEVVDGWKQSALKTLAVTCKGQQLSGKMPFHPFQVQW